MWGNKKPEPATKPAVAPNVSAMLVPMSSGPASTLPGSTPGTLPENVEEIPMNPSEPVRPINTTERAPARLGPSLHVKGEITGNEDLHVDGSVEGLISLEERKLTVGSSAKLTADIVAREVVVYGNVKGNLRARDRIEIKKDGSVVGDLTTARIMIEDGAYFKGSIEIDRGDGAAELAQAAGARSDFIAARAARKDGG